MSSGEVKKVSRQDIQLVQNLIERCLQLYMNQKEVVSTLLHQAKIEPGFTELVWQKLEEENQEFFRAYYLRLIVKDQIQRFNDLLERQVASMRMCATGSIPMSNGSQIWSVPQNSTSQPTDHAGPNVNLENMHQTINGNLPHVYTNGASSVQPTNGASSVRPTNGVSSVQPTNGASSVRPTNGLSSVQPTNGASSVQPYVQAAIDVSAHARRIDVSPNMLMSQSSNLGMMQGLNGGMINSAGYSGNSRFLFGSENNLMEARPGIGDPSVSQFSNIESNSQPLNVNTFDAGASSFGFLGQIPRNFSLSDLTADFTNSSDILDSYSGSAFLSTDTDKFSDPQSRGEHQDINRMDTISEGLSYEDFASD